MRYCLTVLNNHLRKAQSHWRVTGHVKLELHDVDFTMFSKGDDFIVDSIYYNFIDEKVELEMFKYFSQKSSNIIDIGANTGVYTIFASKVNPKAKIVAIEPYLKNFDRLKKNVEANALRNVVLVNKAVADKKEIKEFWVPPDNSISLISSANKEFTQNFIPGMNIKSVKVQYDSLQTILQELSIKQVNLVKIDVENYEIPVFQGALEVFKRDRPFIFCEILHSTSNESYFDNFLEENKYFLYLITPSGILRLDNFCKSNFRTYLFSPLKFPKKIHSAREISELLEQI